MEVPSLADCPSGWDIPGNPFHVPCLWHLSVASTCLLCIPSLCLGATSATAGSKRSCSPCVSQVQSTGEAVVQGLMGAAVTVSNAETSRAVRVELLSECVSTCFPPKSRGQHGKTVVFHNLDLYKGDFLVIGVGLLFCGERT